MIRRITALALLFTCQLFAMVEKPPILMFVGNPGVGKSSIINALKQEEVAKSGVNIGIGLTQFFSEYKHQHEGNNYLLFDTPGLDDIKMRAKAAEEIENALKQEGVYKLFFVITLEAGRVKPADITTIEMVMDAIKREEIVFNIIINKVTKSEKNAFEKENGIKGLYEQLNSGKFKTNNIFYIDMDRDLEDGEKKFFSPNSEFINFIYKESLPIFIKKSEVEKIQIDQFEEISKKHEEQLNELKEKLKEAENKPPQVITQTYYVPSGGGGGLCIIQ